MQFIFGDPTDKGVAGDWNNDVKTTIGIYRSGGVWALNDQNDGSAAEYSFTYGGTVGESYITGNWDNTNDESIGVVR